MFASVVKRYITIIQMKKPFVNTPLSLYSSGGGSGGRKGLG